MNMQNELSKDFSKRFTTEQKSVVLWFLKEIAKADGNVNGSEEQMVGQVMELIGFDLSNKETENIFSKILTYSLAQLVRILNTLDRADKEWFTITMYSLIICDGTAKDDEIGMAIYICSQIGISEQEYSEIIKKTISLYKRFN